MMDRVLIEVVDPAFGIKITLAMPMNMISLNAIFAGMAENFHS